MTLCEPWGQFDNVRVTVGDTAESDEESEAAVASGPSPETNKLPFDEGKPLNSGWSIWEHRKQGKGMTMGKEYMAGMARIADFKTVQGFWQFWNQLPLPSEFFTNKSGHKRVFEDRELEALSVFREGIEPMWEDSMNTNGGEWYLRRPLNPDELDKYWEELVLGCIGETIDEGNEICGVRVVDKSKGSRVNYRLEMWFRRDEPAINERLKKGMMKCMGRVAGNRGPPDVAFRGHKG